MNWLVRTFAGVDAASTPGSSGASSIGAWQLEFTYALATWQWALVIIGAILAAWWCYRGLKGTWWLRTIAASLRALVLMLLALLLTGPKLVLSKESIEKDWVVALVDRSGSMQLRDVLEPGTSQPLSRDEQLRASWNAQSPLWNQLESSRVFSVLGFDGAVYPLMQPSAPAPATTSPSIDPLTAPAASSDSMSRWLATSWPAPTGVASDLPGAIEGALERASARPLAGIILFSDGQSSRAVPRSLIRTLQSQRVSVFVVSLGSEDAVSDLAVASLRHPSSAFAGDPVPVQVRVSRLGPTSLKATGRLQLIDRTTQTVLSEQTVAFEPIPEQASATSTPQELSVTLTAAPPKGATAADWQVAIIPEQRDLSSTNNARDLRMSVVDRPMRVLMIDGLPRWEYRFLKNILSREASLEFAAFILAPGRRFLQEGSEQVLSVPTTPEEWRKFDVIMLGDVLPSNLSQAQQEQLVDRVARGGAGLLWIGGEGAVPAAYRGTPLASLLPMNLTDEGTLVSKVQSDVTLRPTPLAEQLGVLRLLDEKRDGSFWPPAVSDPQSGWSRLRWMQAFAPDQLKPATEILALGIPVDNSSGNIAPLPAVMTMRYGAGRIVYVATDEIWRWRFGRGEELPEKFYLQLIRLLGRESVSRADQPAVLSFSPASSGVNQPVRVQLELIDQQSIERYTQLRQSGSGELSVKLSLAPPTPATAPSTTIDVPLRLEEDQIATSSTGSRVLLVGSFIPPQAGIWTAEASGMDFSGQAVTGRIEVQRLETELARPQTDHALLADLARQTGGAVLAPGELAKLAELLPRREVRTLGIAREITLWDRWYWLAIIISLLTAEWLVRRGLRLV
jgi:hypothetical protein